MNKIPTAEEMEMSGKYDDYSSMMRAFARLHVTAALEAALKEATIEFEPNDYDGSTAYIDKQSILTAYPEENIE